MHNSPPLIRAFDMYNYNVHTTTQCMYLVHHLRSALTFQVRKRVAVILREHLPDDFLPGGPSSSYHLSKFQTPLTESDQGNLVGNFLA